MKKVIYFILFFIVAITFSCKRNLDCKVTVYRSNNSLLPNVEVKMNIYTTASSYATSYKIYKTDSNGSFRISEKFSSKTFIKLECCDGNNGCAYTALIKAKEIGEKIDLRFQ